MKNALRFLIIIVLFINVGYKFSPETYTTPITYDSTLRTTDAGNIGVVKPEVKVAADTLSGLTSPVQAR